MRTATFIAAACQLAAGAAAAASARTASHQEAHPVDIDYAEALDELEREIGSGVHASTEDMHNHHPHHHDTMGHKKRGHGPRRERKALDAMDQLDERLRTFEGGNARDDLKLHFHQRQKEKRAHLDKMHREVSEKLADHHGGRTLLSDEELDQHTKRKAALERKKKSLEEERPERYIERMERHEEKMREKLARKEKRREERGARFQEEL